MIRLSRNFLSYLLDLACKLQQIPSPTFSESQKASFLFDQFLKEDLQEVQIDRAGNVMARIPGGPARPLVISAHIDTVLPASIPLNLIQTPDQIFGPTIGDNSLGAATLLGLVRLLRQEINFELPGDIWLVGNVCEEGLGNLVGMRSVVDHFGNLPIAYLVLEGMGLGQIYHRGLGVERYRITALTGGGHSWVDFGKPSAIHHLAALITRLAALPVPRQPRTSFNVGVIEGGTSVNTIAAKAFFDLDLRSEEPESLNALSSKIRQLVEEANLPDVKFTMAAIGLRPAGSIPAFHPLVRLAETCIRAEGLQSHREIASTDANIPLSYGYPAICIGLTTGGKAHTTEEYIDIEPIHKGIGQLLRLVTSVWNLA